MNLRPSTVDTNNPTLCEAIWVGVFDIGDVPPQLVDPCEGRGDDGEQGECRPHFLVLSVPRKLCCGRGLARERQALVGERAGGGDEGRPRGGRLDERHGLAK